MNAVTTSTTPPSKVKGVEQEESDSRARRVATPRAPHAQPKLFTPKIAVLLLVALAAGAAFGILVTRQRYKSRQIVAAVNGELIQQDDLYSQLERTAGVSAMKTIMDEKLALQFAKKKGVLPTAEEVNARYDEMMKQPGYAEQLKRSGRVPEEVKRTLRVQIAKAKVFEKDVTVTEEEIRRFYTENTNRKDPNARYYTPETIQLAVIVTKTEAAAAKARSDIQHGIQFSTAAKTYSVDDASKQTGGQVGLITRGRTQAAKLPGFEDRVFKMKIGEMIGPVFIAKMWWIIQCLNKTPEKNVRYEEVREECRQGALLLKGVRQNKAKVEAEYAEFRKNANIQAFWPQYKEAVNQR
jgi:foldase protein PrsA